MGGGVLGEGTAHPNVPQPRQLLVAEHGELVRVSWIAADLNHTPPGLALEDPPAIAALLLLHPPVCQVDAPVPQSVKDEVPVPDAALSEDV